MIPIYCNICDIKHNSKHSFELTRCYHIICNKCAPKSADGKKRCPVCKKATQSITIASDMPRNVADYFEDPGIFLKKYKSISKFQSEQRAYHYKNFYEQEKSMEQKRKKLEGYIKLGNQLKEKVEIEKKRIAELRKYIDYHERNSLNTSESSGENRRRCRPKTPSHMSTDIDSENDLNNDCLTELQQMLNQTSRY